VAVVILMIFPGIRIPLDFGSGDFLV
jgi:hypothetical protein